ncbi:glycosyltransferase [Leuconostoc falkenbergense]|uniref:glycosyltransferase n=1 Tax=Leuconostoc falkenbergense TaxID=2766470 RepID=UPI0021AAE0F4|nr:glycosyltransferase [Leuconostoc falkenbergense]MCT4390801.1 glycosyltransferase [Leuconostoc falkenbergense]
MHNKPVAVLMSTYNGEAYLFEQINSILNQTYQNIHLFIRDDGSTDNTVSIIQKFIGNPKISFIQGGDNLGYKNSFLMLLKTVVDLKKNYQYFAFSDQDDIWLKDKILVSIKELEKDDFKYCIYFSGLTFVDSKLNKLKIKDDSNVRTTFPAEMVRHSISGATSVFSRDLAELAVKYTEVEKLPGGHDEFIFRLNAAIGGHFFADNKNYIKFRRHADNASTATKGLLFKIVHEFNKEDSSVVITAQFLRTYYKNKLTASTLHEIEMLLNYNRDFKSKWLLLKNKKFRRENSLMNIIFFYRVIVSKL